MQRYGSAVVVAGVWMLWGIVAVVAQTLAPISGETMRAGEQYFVRYCSACHGLQGRGDGPAASALRTPPADLTRLAQRRGGQFPTTEIAAFIDGRTALPAHGSREMPIWGERFATMGGGGSVGEEVVRGNLLVLLDYLQTLQRK